LESNLKKNVKSAVQPISVHKPSNGFYLLGGIIG